MGSLRTALRPLTSCDVGSGHMVAGIGPGLGQYPWRQPGQAAMIAVVDGKSQTRACAVSGVPALRIRASHKNICTHASEVDTSLPVTREVNLLHPDHKTSGQHTDDC